MIRDRFDVGGSDYPDLEDAAAEVLHAAGRREGRALTVLEELLERRTSLPWKEIKEALETDLREAGAGGRAAARAAAETFVQELTLRGWALLPPREVRRITPPRAPRVMVKMRAPRVKTLREE